MTELDRILGASVESGDVPGVVAIAATPGGTLYEGAFGRRGILEPAPMGMDTVFRIASMTKAVTAAAAMQCVEEGGLSLNEPAGRIVDGLAAPKVLEGFDATGRPRLRDARGTVTLRNLLTHTSGFGYDIWNADLLRYHRETGNPAPRSGKLAGLDAPLTFDPNTRWQYGIGLDWVGRMVEAIRGADLEGVFQSRLFAPLDMRDTSYVLRPDMQARLAAVHARSPAGLEQLAPEPPPAREFYPGGGGLHATPRDYIRFLQMLINHGTLGGQRVLRAETVQTMFENHMGDIDVEPLRSAVPASSNDVDLLPGIRKKWGLSFLINAEQVPGRRSAGSLAWAGLYNTYFWLDPTQRVAGAIFTQILPFADPAVLRLFEAFESAVYRAL